jgi:ABC-type glycerol-3-phosphate transport system substrate-binding protein
MLKRMSLVRVICMVFGVLLWASGATASPVTINCFGTLPPALVEQFNKQNLDVKLVVELPQELTETAYQNAVRSGKYDLVLSMASPGYMDQWVQDGLFLSLNAYIKRDGINIKSFVGNLAEAMRLDNNLYDLPLRLMPYHVVYNRDLFDSKGVDCPRPGWTWDDFREMATRLTGKTPDSHGAVVPVDVWAVMAEQHANRIYEATLEEYASILAFTKSMVSDKSLSIDLPEEVNGGFVMVTNMGFETGKIAMQVTRYPPRIGDFPIGIAPLPAPKGQQSTTPVTVLSMGIPKAARHAAEAWRVIRFLTTPQASQLLADSGWLPAVNLNPHVLGLWATARIGSVPAGLESLAGINLSVAGRRFEQINTDFWYFLEGQANEFFRGRQSEDSVLQAIREEGRSANSRARAILSSR